MPKKPEAKVNDRLRDAIKLIPEVDGHRMENRVGLGRPDWDLFVRRTDGSCELVMIESKFARTKSRPLAGWVPAQRSWCRRKIEMGFRVYLLLGYPDGRIQLLDAGVHLESDQVIRVVLEWKNSINHKDLKQVLLGG